MCILLLLFSILQTDVDPADVRLVNKDQMILNSPQQKAEYLGRGSDRPRPKSQYQEISPDYCQPQNQRIVETSTHKIGNQNNAALGKSLHRSNQRSDEYEDLPHQAENYQLESLNSAYFQNKISSVKAFHGARPYTQQSYQHASIDNQYKIKEGVCEPTTQIIPQKGIHKQISKSYISFKKSQRKK